jgi:hypothetical protein
MAENEFPPDEAITESTNPAVLAAKLVRDWHDCPRAYQRMLLRLAERGARLAKPKATS